MGPPTELIGPRLSVVCIQLTEDRYETENSDLTRNCMLAGTRVALGIGIGLLLAERLNRETRKGAACALLLVGALSTIPLAIGVLNGSDNATVPESV